MLTFGANVRIYLHARPTDMRNSFDGLCALVRNVFQADPLDGSLFLFVNLLNARSWLPTPRSPVAKTSGRVTVAVLAWASKARAGLQRSLGRFATRTVATLRREGSGHRCAVGRGLGRVKSLRGKSHETRSRLPS
jgi:transposase